MYKLILLYTLLFSGVFLVNGARSDSDVVLGSISGRVIDNVRKQPVAYAAIVIKLASDKTIITGGITNEDGTFQLFGFYRGQNRNIQFDVDPMYIVNLGARYNFAQGKGTFSVNFNDVFNTMHFAFVGDQPFDQIGEFYWESQTVFAGVSYRFGSGKNKAVKRKRRDSNTKQNGGGIL